MQVRFPIRRLFPEELLSPDISERLRGHCVVPYGIQWHSRGRVLVMSTEAERAIRSAVFQFDAEAVGIDHSLKL